MKRLWSYFDFEEKCVLVVAMLGSAVFGLLAFAGFSTRAGADHERMGYAAGWAAFWLATTTILFIIAGALIHAYREQKGRRR